MIPNLPAVILVRAGSQRLHEKWRLSWRGVTLPENAIRVALRCKYVSSVIMATDSDDLIALTHRRFGEGTREHYSRTNAGALRVTTVRRPKVGPEQKSLDGLRWVLEQQGLQASYCLLIQATFPFLSAGDLDRLVETWHDRDASIGMFLSKPGAPRDPAGAAWLVCPYKGYASVSPVAVTTPCVDIDVREDYDAALEIERAQKP